MRGGAKDRAAPLILGESPAAIAAAAGAGAGAVTGGVVRVGDARRDAGLGRPRRRRRPLIARFAVEGAARAPQEHRLGLEAAAAIAVVTGPAAAGQVDVETVQQRV